MPKPSLSDKIMPFGEHLEELRRRLILALAAIIPVFVVSLWVGKYLLNVLLKPGEHALRDAGLPPNFQVTNFFELFNSVVKTSLILTVLICSPWILYQVWRFVAPGLYANERRFAYLLSPLSTVLTLASALFMYFVMMPVVFGFFVRFNSSLPMTGVSAAPPPPGIVLPVLPMLPADPVPAPPGSMWYNTTVNQLRISTGLDAAGAPIVKGTPMTSSDLVSQQYKIADYIDTFFSFALAFALAFQMPVVVLLLGWAGIVQPWMLVKYRRYAIMACVVLGAVLTPADPISLFLLAGPLYLLYELGLLLLRFLPAERVAGGRRGGDDDNGGDGGREGPDAPAVG